MTRLLLATAAAALVATPALAGLTVNIDRFSTSQGPVEDLGLGGGPVSSGPLVYTEGAHTYTREFSIELIALLAPVQAQAQVVSGVFDVLNGSGEQSVVVLSYTLPASLEALRLSLPTTLVVQRFLFDLVARDQVPMTITAELNGASLGPVVPPLGAPGEYQFNMVSGTPVSGSLVFTITGDPGFDITLDNLRIFFESDPPFGTPAPTMLGLFGLGLATLGLRRRRAR